MSSSALAAGIRQLRGQLAAQQHDADSDEQLLHAFLSRREDSAFTVLVRRHGPMVLHVCRRVLGHVQDAEDAFQATFLVLARNAGSLRDKTSLASFLYGTAYRIAMKAKQAAARRRQYEGQAPSRPPADPADELSWREMRTLLDEEIACLPEIYRSVFVLCYLEGLSRAETAQRLGLKECTVLSRLAEARKRLSQRLARRGVELTAVLAAATLATQTASALPAGLMATTIKAALATAAGEGLASVVSASVAALVKDATAAMMVSKAKIATVLLLTASMLTGASVWAYRGLTANVLTPSTQPAEPAAAKADDKPNPGPTKREAAKTVEIQGRVLGPDGKPKAGAKLLLLDRKGNVKQLGATEADGGFAVVVPKEATSDWEHWLIAQAEGFGIDFLGLHHLKHEKPVALRLVKDNAIHGRVVNTEGKPVRGVRVAVTSIDDPTEISLDSFLVAWKKRSFGSSIGSKKHFRTDGDTPIMTTTDAEGRFIIHGAGVERIVSLHFSGNGIAEEERCVVNRAGFDPEPYNQAARDKIPNTAKPYGTWFLHGPNVSIVAEAEKPVHGIVTDADSGKPLPGVRVRCFNQRAKTDTEGRYQVHGVGKAKSYTIEVASNPATGYMASQVRAADTAGYQPIRANLRVKKGVIITGKVIDQATGQSVPGYAAAAALADNPFVKEYPEMSSYSLHGDREYTDGDGPFRIVALPGPVLLMVGFDYTQSTGNPAEGMKYAGPLPDPKYPQYFAKDRDWARYHAFGGGAAAVQGKFCKVLEIKPGTTVVHQDAVLRLASALPVKIEDAEGQPVRGAWATGISSSGDPPVQIDKADCSAYGVKAGKPRHMVFFHLKRKIAGRLTLTGNEKQPAVVQLRPMGSIKGRLLDLDGKPLVGIVVGLRYRDPGTFFVHEFFYGRKQVVTDAAGAFTLDELVPELKFELSFQQGKRCFEHQAEPAEATIQVKPRECHDLGAIRVKRLPERTEE